MIKASMVTEIESQLLDRLVDLRDEIELVPIAHCGDVLKRYVDVVQAVELVLKAHKMQLIAEQQKKVRNTNG